MNTTDRVRKVLETVCDPEIPPLSIADLGILRDIYCNDDRVVVVITPTYSGCPAMQAIEDDILAALEHAGIEATVETRLAPAWTTDWLTEAGREKLRQIGIAPPAKSCGDKRSLRGLVPQKITCPQCASNDTEVISEFGSTACKALYRCLTCREPFDYFKCH